MPRAIVYDTIEYLTNTCVSTKTASEVGISVRVKDSRLVSKDGAAGTWYPED
jgi:hypothetical protein